MDRQLLLQPAVSGGLVGASAFIITLFGAAGIAMARAAVRRSRPGAARVLRDSFALVALTLWLMIGHSLAIWTWAGAYLRLELFADLATALYFSAVNYTTLGYGDIVPPTHWGLLAGAEAACGLLMFGLSAAVLVEAGLKLRMAEKSP